MQSQHCNAVCGLQFCDVFANHLMHTACPCIHSDAFDYLQHWLRCLVDSIRQANVSQAGAQCALTEGEVGSCRCRSGGHACSCIEDKKKKKKKHLLKLSV